MDSSRPGSVSPIRDALRLLAADGLVELRSRRGAFVAEPSRTVILEAFQFRAILERAAVDATVAAGSPLVDMLRAHVEALPPAVVGDTHADSATYIRHDQAFHQILIDALGNRMLSENFANLASFTLTVRMLHRARTHGAAIDDHLYRANDYLARLADAAARKKEVQSGDRAQHLSRAKEAKVAATGML